MDEYHFGTSNGNKYEQYKQHKIAVVFDSGGEIAKYRDDQLEGTLIKCEKRPMGDRWYLVGDCVYHYKYFFIPSSSGWETQKLRGYIFDEVKILGNYTEDMIQFFKSREYGA